MHVFLFSGDGLVWKSHCLLRENETKAQREEGQDNRVSEHKQPTPGLLPLGFLQQVGTGDHCSLDKQPGKPRPSGLCARLQVKMPCARRLGVTICTEPW